MNIAEIIYGDEASHLVAHEGTIAFGLLATSYEIFLEVYLLASNGFWRGAQARLRTMYEHVSVAAYIAKHPEQARRFISFHIVEQKKELSRAKELFERPGNEEFLAKVDGRLTAINAKLQITEAEFGKAFSRSWHGGMKIIAKDLAWERYFLYCYLIPNRHVHASALVLERSVSSGDQLYFEGTIDHDSADEAIRGAFSMLVLSYGVAQDVGVHVPDQQFADLVKNVIGHYENFPNMIKL